MQNINFTIEQVVNFGALDAEMRAVFGERISGISAIENRVIVHVLEPAEGDEALAQAALDAHDPDALTPEQAALRVAEDAPARAAAIPGWATWDEAQAVAYIENNVKDLASAKVVLIAMARVLVALRDAQWPLLGLDK